MVISTVNQVIYNGDGVTTSWPFTFRIIDATDIKLTIIDSDGTETPVSADYYVDMVNSTVHYPGYAPGAEPPEEEQPAPVQSGQKLLIYRQLPITQEKDLGEKWPFYVIELALDKLTMILQQVAGWWDRCLKISPVAEAEHPDFDMTFPIEAGKSFRVNAEGTGFEVSDDPGISAEVAIEAANTAAAAAEVAAAAAAAVELQAVWYDNVSALRSANIPVGITAGTKGYFAPNDGGGGTYVIREADGDTDDGGAIIILNNGNVAELIYDGSVNIKQFGAAGDGVTNDTNAIQNAFNAAKHITFMAGENYLVSSNIKVLKSGVTIDLNNSTIAADGTTRYIFNCANGETTTGYNGHGDLTIKNGTMIHMEIGVAHAQNIVVQGINFRNSDDHFIQVMSCKNVLISRCTFKGISDDASDSSQECINLDPCNYSAFSIYGSGSPAYDGTNNENIVVEYCVSEQGTDTGYTSPQRLGFSHYHVDNTLYHNHVTIKNNIVSGQSTMCCMRLYDCRHADVHDNQIITNDGYGIELGYGQRNMIHDNDFAVIAASIPKSIRVRTGGETSLVVWNNIFGASKTQNDYLTLESTSTTFSKLQKLLLYSGTTVSPGSNITISHPYNIFNHISVGRGAVIENTYRSGINFYGFNGDVFEEATYLSSDGSQSLTFVNATPTKITSNGNVRLMTASVE